MFAGGVLSARPGCGRKDPVAECAETMVNGTSARRRARVSPPPPLVEFEPLDRDAGVHRFDQRAGRSDRHGGSRVPGVDVERVVVAVGLLNELADDRDGRHVVVERLSIGTGQARPGHLPSLRPRVPDEAVRLDEVWPCGLGRRRIVVSAGRREGEILRVTRRPCRDDLERGEVAILNFQISVGVLLHRDGAVERQRDAVLPDRRRGRRRADGRRLQRVRIRLGHQIPHLDPLPLSHADEAGFRAASARPRLRGVKLEMARAVAGPIHPAHLESLPGVVREDDGLAEQPALDGPDGGGAWGGSDPRLDRRSDRRGAPPDLSRDPVAFAEIRGQGLARPDSRPRAGGRIGKC